MCIYIFTYDNNIIEICNMALMPSHKLYPKTTTIIDSFHSSVVTKFRYGSPIPVKNQSFHSNINNIISNPQKRFNFLLTKKNNSLCFASNCINRNVNFSSVSSGCGKNSTWLDKWNETHKGNKLKKPQVVLNYKNNGDFSGSDGEDNNGSRTDVSGSTMERIVKKLKKFGFNDDVIERKEEGRRVIEKGSIEDIFYVEDGMLPNSRGGFSEKSPLGDDNVFGNGGEVRFPWEKPELVREEEKKCSVRERSRTCLAELTLPESEMRRLTNLGLQIKNKTKIGGSGVTKEVVEKIHAKWKSSEVVRLKIEGAPALNMKRMHEILERKTGGLVIWRSGTSVSLYRGVSYEAPSERSNKRIYKKDDIPHNFYPTTDDGNSNDTSQHNNGPPSQVESTSTGEENKSIEAPPEVTKYEHEIDILLDGLGPRYTDWPAGDPLPIDADLLPGVVPGYQPPFRLLPYGVRSTLGMKEGTALRRLARVLPPHFALGRSRQHQGLAAAMVKLWERSSVAKIAVKRGVQLTTSERMAEDIKRLTGGILLSRNKDFLVFYRGKNFLSPEVAEALLEKERLAKSLQDEEEQARLRASAFFSKSVETTDRLGTTAGTGTLGETLDADARWGKKLNDDDREKVMREAEITRHSNLVRKLEKKLVFAERKIMKAERALSKVEESLTPADPSDPQSLTDEERFMFRKLGLRMKAFLLLGRRGIFDGTVENMHLHWKYRELVKIIVKAKFFEQVKTIALSLEAESGGVLVSVDKVSKGYAVIVFRGRDYSRPSTLRPKNLLTKRKALARSIELQRRGALLHHISTLQTRVNQLRSEIGQMAAVEDRGGDEELYDKIDAAYSTEDEDSEEEGEDAYLEIYETDDDTVDGNDSATETVDGETNFPYAFQGQSEEVKR